MTDSVLKQLEELCPANLPPEMLLDPYHPSNDRYYESLNGIKRSIVSHRAKMKGKEIEANRLFIAGKNYTEIAQTLNITSQTASRYINSPAGQRLRSLYQHLTHALDGPNIDHRKAILWRITIDNEKNRPNVAIQALQEINKMTGAYQPSDSSVVSITINNQLLPRTALDQQPDTYESRRKREPVTVTVAAEPHTTDTTDTQDA